jgi:hypothetical protein
MGYFLALLFTCLEGLRAFALPMTVDPGGAGFTGTFAVEWNTAADFEGWVAGMRAGSDAGTPPASRAN